MPRRTAKKKTTQATQATAPTAEAPPSDGGALLADMEKQCASLREWHREASASLEAQQTQLTERAEQLSRQQAAVAKTNEQLNAELAQLAEARAEVETQRQALAAVRNELENEWTALRDLRDAQHKLGRELDAERDRLNQRAFKITTNASGSAGSTKRATRRAA